MRRTPMSLRVIAALAAGCGGDDNAGKAPAVRDGAVVYRDALRDNHGGWLLDKEKHFTFVAGAYHWRNIAAATTRRWSCPTSCSSTRFRRGSRSPWSPGS